MYTVSWGVQVKTGLLHPRYSEIPNFCQKIFDSIAITFIECWKELLVKFENTTIDTSSSCCDKSDQFTAKIETILNEQGTFGKCSHVKENIDTEHQKLFTK